MREDKLKNIKENSEKVNLIDGEIWVDKDSNSIEIIRCYDDYSIVEVKLSNSLTSREFPMKIIKQNIYNNNFKRQV